MVSVRNKNNYPSVIIEYSSYLELWCSTALPLVKRYRYNSMFWFKHILDHNFTIIHSNIYNVCTF